jgi:hypothetical protein
MAFQGRRIVNLECVRSIRPRLSHAVDGAAGTTTEFCTHLESGDPLACTRLRPWTGESVADQLGRRPQVDSSRLTRPLTPGNDVRCWRLGF